MYLIEYRGKNRLYSNSNDFIITSLFYVGQKGLSHKFPKIELNFIYEFRHFSKNDKPL